MLPMDTTSLKEKSIEVFQAGDGSIYGAGVATDGKLRSHVRLFRLTDNGAVDADYGENGGVTDAVEFIADEAVFDPRHRVTLVGEIWGLGQVVVRQLWY